MTSVTAFVSYCRRDNDDAKLLRIHGLVAPIGVPYIDDLYEHGPGDRLANLTRALTTADVFVAVLTRHYLRTAWTQREYAFATRAGLRIATISPPSRTGASVLSMAGTSPDPLGPEFTRRRTTTPAMDATLSGHWLGAVG